MQDISIAAQIYGLGFIISFFIACLIKAMLFVIRHFSKEEAPSES